MSTADWKQEWLNLNAAASIMGQYIGELDAEVNRLREEIKRIAGITNGYVGPTKAWAEHITKDLLAVIE